jgi:hypothetical protein
VDAQLDDANEVTRDDKRARKVEMRNASGGGVVEPDMDLGSPLASPLGMASGQGGLTSPRSVAASYLSSYPNHGSLLSGIGATVSNQPTGQASIVGFGAGAAAGRMNPMNPTVQINPNAQWHSSPSVFSSSQIGNASTVGGFPSSSQGSTLSRSSAKSGSSALTDRSALTSRVESVLSSKSKSGPQFRTTNLISGTEEIVLLQGVDEKEDLTTIWTPLKKKLQDPREDIGALLSTSVGKAHLAKIASAILKVVLPPLTKVPAKTMDNLSTPYSNMVESSDSNGRREKFVSFATNQGWIGQIQAEQKVEGESIIMNSDFQTMMSDFSAFYLDKDIVKQSLTIEDFATQIDTFKKGLTETEQELMTSVVQKVLGESLENRKAAIKRVRSTLTEDRDLNTKLDMIKEPEFVKYAESVIQKRAEMEEYSRQFLLNTYWPIANDKAVVQKVQTDLQALYSNLTEAPDLPSFNRKVIEMAGNLRLQQGALESIMGETTYSPMTGMPSLDADQQLVLANFAKAVDKVEATVVSTNLSNASSREAAQGAIRQLYTDYGKFTEVVQGAGAAILDQMDRVNSYVQNLDDLVTLAELDSDNSSVASTVEEQFRANYQSARSANNPEFAVAVDGRRFILPTDKRIIQSLRPQQRRQMQF